MSKINWHKPFQAALKLELMEYSGRLEFFPEFSLSGGAHRVDELLIHKKDSEPICKNIGHIFQTYNFFEFKGLSDSIGRDDFSRLLGCACLFVYETGRRNEILFEQLTLSFVSLTYPRKLLKYLKENLELQIENPFPGVYYIGRKGRAAQIQYIHTGALALRENVWLNCISDRLSQHQLQQLGVIYQKHQNEPVYEDYMNTIIRANREKGEDEPMCDAIRELFADENVKQKRELKEQYEQIVEQEKLIQARNQQIQSQIQKLQDQDQQLKNQDQQLKSQDQQIKSQDQQIKSQDQQLKSQDQQLKSQGQQIKSQDLQIQEMAERIRFLETQLKQAQA